MNGYCECVECGTNFHRDGGTDYKMDICGDWLCEDCAKEAVKISVTEMSDGRFYGHSEKWNEEVSTGFFTIKQEAMNRIIEMVEKLYGEARIVED